MKKTVAVLAVLLTWSTFVPWVFAGALDGTQWRVEITPEGATIPHHVDRILFNEGKFTSKIFERRGFPSASYSGSASSWSAEQTGAEGELNWKGSIEGEALKGTLVWKQADGKVVTHALVGIPYVEEVIPPEGGGPETTATVPGTPSTPSQTGGQKPQKSQKSKKGFFGCSLVR